MFAQQTPDSVTVRVETSAGAEIGIDGDISSNNILTKKVAVGKHKVIVKYGNSYTKEYELDVTGENGQKCSYPIAGKVQLQVTPVADVYVDGIRRGKSPLSIELLGNHSIRLEGDISLIILLWRV